MTDTTLAPSPTSVVDAAPTWMPLTAESIDQIIAIPDPSLRNLWITQSYADLAHRLLPVLGGNQSWCSFAVWASNTAGRSIRGQELPLPMLRSTAGESTRADALVDAANSWGLRHLVGRRFEHHHLRDLVSEALADVSAHIAHGNTLVYAELAPVFVRFLDHLDAHDAPSADDVGDLVDACGIPRNIDAALVRSAFKHYAHAAAGGHDAAQHVLAGNVAAVLHEQHRLQPDVAAALDAGLVDLAGHIEQIGRRWLPDGVRRLLGRLATRRAGEHIQRLWGEIATHLLMTMDVPDQTLHLGRDVPPPPDGDVLFPVDLDPMTLRSLLELMNVWDPTGGTGFGSGADDWSELHDRMGYIVNLFRSRQQTTALTRSPFSHDQLDAMRSGRMPASL